MAEVGRRTVIIRGQVVDRYSPRRSLVEVDVGERRSRDDSPEYRPRARRSPADRGERPRRAAGYEFQRSAADEPRSLASYEGPSSAAYQPRRATASERRRRRPYDPPRARPDRIARWAVLLGVVLLLAAATGSHAAVIAHAVAH